MDNLSNPVLQQLFNDANLTLEDIRELYSMKEENEILKNYKFPKNPSSDGYYHIYVTDSTKKSGRRPLKDKTLSGLQKKVIKNHTGDSVETRKNFHDIFEIVQTEKLKYIKNPEKLLSAQNTILRNRSEYNRFFSGTKFEKKYIDEITKENVESIVFTNLNQYELTKKGLASMKSILRSVFSLAYSMYWINDNEYSRVDFTKYNDMLIDSTPVEERAHSDQDIERMLTYIHEWQKKKPNYIPAYALEMQIICGLRRGELPPLLWDDVKDNYIFIHQEQLTVKKTATVPEHFKIVSHTKNYKNRKYPRTNEVQDFLDRLQIVHDRYYSKSKFLFPADTDNGCITNNQVYNYYRRICRKLNIKVDKDIIKGTHAFRRTRITQVINNSNGNVILASQLFGNSPEVAKKNYYTGIDLDQAKLVLNR